MVPRDWAEGQDQRADVLPVPQERLMSDGAEGDRRSVDLIALEVEY